MLDESIHEHLVRPHACGGSSKLVQDLYTTIIQLVLLMHKVHHRSKLEIVE